MQGTVCGGVIAYLKIYTVTTPKKNALYILLSVSSTYNLKNCV